MEGRFDLSCAVFDLMLKCFGRMDIKIEGIQEVVKRKIKSAGKGSNQKDIKEKTRARIHELVSNSVAGLTDKFLADTAVNLSSDFAPDEVGLIINDLRKNVRVNEVMLEEISKTTEGLEHGLNKRQFDFVDKVRGLITYAVELGRMTGRAEVGKEIIDITKNCGVVDYSHLEKMKNKLSGYEAG